MIKILSLETIMLRTKNDKINSLTKLNLWGNDLEDVSCILNVPNLEVISLAVNKINTLKPFSRLLNLKELYLRQNKISNLSEINFLKNCKRLTVLSLSENPLCDCSNYRKKIIQMLPQILKLDDKVISIEERNSAENGDYCSDEDDKNYDDKEEEENLQEEKSSVKKLTYDKKASNIGSSGLSGNINDNNNNNNSNNNLVKVNNKGGFCALNKRGSQILASKGKFIINLNFKITKMKIYNNNYYQ